MKKLFFVSTGRCGTVRLYQILKEKLPESYLVIHQRPLSRFINIMGNIIFIAGSPNSMRKSLFNLIKKDFMGYNSIIILDPLISMIIPDEELRSEDVCVVQIIRDEKEFARSMFRLTRSRLSSFIAHNFIPLWQPGLYPLENLFSSKILDKYVKICKLKNYYFKKHYQKNPNFRSINMKELFSPHVLENLIYYFFDETINISEKELKIKANESGKNKEIYSGFSTSS